MPRPTRPAGFTLIELLVVISIIALLVGILLPALGASRKEAIAVKCMANSRSVATAMTVYVTESKEYYPASYLYASTPGGFTWTWTDQLGTDPPTGYIHWSYHLFQNGAVNQDAFKCGEFEKGGTPATNPHDDGKMPGQTFGAAYPSPDRQARWMAYTANAALIPRNKFSGGTRNNEFVRASDVDNMSKVILVTEFNKNWKAVTDSSGGDTVSKSHRPVNAFQGISSGTGNGIYGEPNTPGVARFRYASLGDLVDKTAAEAEEPGNLLNSTTELNAVGRHHSGGDDYGGTANFAYADGHCKRKTVAQTITDRDWGERHYSITGFDGVQ